MTPEKRAFFQIPREMVCTDLSEQLQRMHVAEPRAQRSALVISPSGGGRASAMEVCIVTQAGEEIWWEQVQQGSWRDEMEAVERAVGRLEEMGILPHCIAYVDNSLGRGDAYGLCELLDGLGCVFYGQAAQPGMCITRALVEQYSVGFDHWVRGWAHAMAANLPE
jgi:hypothetical protein